MDDNPSLHPCILVSALLQIFFQHLDTGGRYLTLGMILLNFLMIKIEGVLQILIMEILIKFHL